MPPPLDRTPASLDDAPPPRPCPRCGRDLEVFADYFADFDERQRRVIDSIDGLAVLLCRSCLRIGVDVPGIAIAWRGEETPTAAMPDVLLRDAIDGVRQRRFLDAEPGDPWFR